MKTTCLAGSALAVALLSTSPAPAQAPLPPARAVVAERTQAVVRERLAHPKGPASISVAIVRHGEALVEQAWGLADARAKQPASAAMTYRIGSVSKQFTAALILRLVDRGRLATRDRLSRHLAGLPPAWQPITIEQLLNHTAGLARDYRVGSLLSLALLDRSGATRLEVATRDPLASPPGTKHEYSNTGYMVLGVLIEKFYGKRYADLVRDEIARPLGLTTLGWCAEQDKRPTEARGHVRSPDGTLEPAAEIADLLLGDGGLCGTAGDLARWNQALHGGRVLSPASYQAMITPRGAAIREHYGFGIRVLRSPSGGPVITHDGATITFVSENAWYPADRLSVTVLYNSGPGPGTGPLGARLATIARGQPPIPATAAVAGGLAAMVGFYEGRPGRGFEITLDHGALYAKPTDNTKQKLVRQSGTTYAAGDTGSSITFTSDSDGRVTALVFRTGTLERTFTKVR